MMGREEGKGSVLACQKVFILLIFRCLGVIGIGLAQAGGIARQARA